MKERARERKEETKINSDVIKPRRADPYTNQSTRTWFTASLRVSKIVDRLKFVDQA